jgi:hypothetical protein
MDKQNYTHPTMKSKLHLQSLTAIFFLIVSLSTAPAQKGPGALPVVDPNTGLPLPQARTLPAMDPVTGLPQPPSAPWKDPNWKDPDIVLTNVNFVEGLPVGEVARYLREEFKNSFDTLLPGNWSDPNRPNESLDPQSFMVRLQLKNVTASEVFNAMNLLFETENTPLRWELKMNGKRPTALLRVLASPKYPPPAIIDPTTGLPVPPPVPEPKRMVYFVGDLTGDAKSGGMTMEQIVKTVEEIWDMTYHEPGGVQFHKDAQLLIVSGTPDQIAFVQQTLGALRVKVQLDRERHQAAESKPKTDEPKSGVGGNSGSK